MTWKKIQEKTIRMEAKMPEIMKYVARPCLVVWFEFQGFTDPYYSMDIFILDSQVVIFSDKWPAWGLLLGTQITSRGWIFL